MASCARSVAGIPRYLATRWSRERAVHSRCRRPIGAKTDGRVKIIKLLSSGIDMLDWTPPLLWLWQRRHDREAQRRAEHCVRSADLRGGDLYAGPQPRPDVIVTQGGLLVKT